MLRSLTISAVAMLLVPAVLVGSAPHTLAEEDPVSWAVLVDGRGDVWAGSDAVAFSEWVPARKPTADVTRVRVTHGRYAVRTRMRFSALRRLGEEVYAVVLRTPDRTVNALVYGGEGFGAGEHVLIDDETPALVECKGLSHDVDYARDLVRVSIPRRCIGRPDWIRARFFNYVWAEPVGGGPSGYADNPHNHRATATGFTARLPWAG